MTDKKKKLSRKAAKDDNSSMSQAERAFSELTKFRVVLRAAVEKNESMTGAFKKAHHAKVVTPARERTRNARQVYLSAAKVEFGEDPVSDLRRSEDNG